MFGTTNIFSIIFITFQNAVEAKGMRFTQSYAMPIAMLPDSQISATWLVIANDSTLGNNFFRFLPVKVPNVLVLAFHLQAPMTLHARLLQSTIRLLRQKP
jgi:hypothetical protein